MYRRGWIAVTLVALGVLILGSYGIGQAAGHAAGQGPGDALAVPDDWQTLTAGQQGWYAFDYNGDNSEILVRLSASPTGSASFAVWSPGDVERWRRGDAVEPTGRGSANARYGGDLVWTSSSPSRGRWYVIVEPSAGNQTWFSLKVGGSGVTTDLAIKAAPSPTSARPVSTPAAAKLQAATARPVSAAGSTSVLTTPTSSQGSGLAYYNPRTPTPTPIAQNPDDALPLPDATAPQTLGVGQHAWYAFEYAGDRSQIQIRLHAAPEGSATFTVWSWDVLQRWWEGYFYTPTGRGTASKVYGGDLLWSGQNIIKGKWYVEVEQSGKSPSTYTLEVTGTGVGRTLPPTPTPSPTYSLPMPTRRVYK